MKSPLSRLGLTILLASTITAHAMVDQIPYYIAGQVSTELAKRMGKWVAQEQLGMNKTLPITSVTQQDLKFVFSTGLQAFLSAGLPALNQQAPQRAPALQRIVEEAVDRTITPAPLTQGTLRPQLSADQLQHAARQNIPVLQTPGQQAVAAFKAGAKYIAISEFVEYVAKVVEEWEKAQAQKPIVVTTNANEIAVAQSTDQCPFDEPSFLNPLTWYSLILEKAQNVCNRGDAVWHELWDNKALAMYIAIHMAVAYHVTRFTMITSRMFREMTFVNRGYEIFKLDPFKQVFETTMGVFMSMYIKPYVTMPLLAKAGNLFGFDTVKSQKAADAAYLAGIKAPFAYDALYDTVTAGTVPTSMLASFFTLDRLHLKIADYEFRELVTGIVFAIQIGWAYYVTRYQHAPQQHAHAH